MPEVSVTECHPLRSVCILLNAVSNHLAARAFISPTLTTDLLPASTRIVYKSGNDDRAREDALPIVAYNVTGIALKPFNAAYSLGDKAGNTSAEMGGSIQFSISTTNEALTSELALEIGQFCMSVHKLMQQYEMFIGGVNIKGTTKGKAGYFDAIVVVEASLGKPTWNNSSTASILREIGMQIAFQ